MALGRWNRGRVLGRGSTATVILASANDTGELFAVKSAELACSSALQREHRILSSLDYSNNVVSCLGHDLSAGRYNLFLEYAPGGSLADEVARRGGRIAELSVRSRVREVLTGLAYLHSRRIVHCDVKSQNILIGSDGLAKVADLGCAKLLDEDRPQLGGTPMFMAPEVARGESQGPEADVWAVGCVAIEMAAGRAPWPGVSDAIAVLHRIAFSEDVPAAPEWMSDEGKDFLGRCLRRDPQQRWSAARLLSHPFVQNLDKECNWISPKSILDQSIWECLEEEEEDDDDDEEAAAACLVAPQQMIADLVGGSSSAGGLNWTWDEDWLSVRTDDNNDDDGKEYEAPEATTQHMVMVGDGSLAPAGSNEDTVVFNNATVGHHEDSVIYSHTYRTDADDDEEDRCAVGSSRRDLVTERMFGHFNLVHYRSSWMNSGHVNYSGQSNTESSPMLFSCSACFCFLPLLCCFVSRAFLVRLVEATYDSTSLIVNLIFRKL